MILSYFIKENELHILAGDISKIHHIANAHDIADIAPTLIHNAIAENLIQDVNKIVYPLGPGSFTATRTMSSIAIGFLIANTATEIIGVSSFLSYSSVVGKIHKSYLIAIPAIGGDFFVHESSKDLSMDCNIASAENIANCDSVVFYPNSEIFTDINLAAAQVGAYNARCFGIKCFT
ncbi:MAG: hypothetical protein LBD43_02645 [Holosporales bacterium]|jgi:tRNA A37 threonylcarbamoyladenosine modification protein TsaB|nr:hypothetical protein [Holosporales bacterium]